MCAFVSCGDCRRLQAHSIKPSFLTHEPIPWHMRNRRTIKPNTVALKRILGGVEGHNKRVLAPIVEVCVRALL